VFGSNQEDFPGWSATHGPVRYMQEPDAMGPTALIAAMRCWVLRKLGPTIDVPDELF